MKRGGAGHTSLAVKDLDDGSLAVECPACPHPERNLPPEWENVDEDRAYVPPSVFTLRHPVTIHYRWLYSLFIAIDANFRLKMKSRGIQDPELGSGLAYFVNAAKLEAHLKDHATEDDVRISDPFASHDREFTYRKIETCGTEFHAVNQASSKRSKDYAVTGVGAVVCRHGLVRKNGVVDLQKGERCVSIP